MCLLSGGTTNDAETGSRRGARACSRSNAEKDGDYTRLLPLSCSRSEETGKYSFCGTSVEFLVLESSILEFFQR